MAADTWKNFEQSGRVADYLAYRRSTEHESPVQAGEAVFLEKGMGSYGSKHHPDGDGIKCHACRGI